MAVLDQRSRHQHDLVVTGFTITHGLERDTGQDRPQIVVAPFNRQIVAVGSESLARRPPPSSPTALSSPTQWAGTGSPGTWLGPGS